MSYEPGVTDIAVLKKVGSGALPDRARIRDSAPRRTSTFHGAARLAAALFTLVQAGCSSEKVVEPAVATSLAAVSSATLSGNVGTAVQPPSVIVKDQRGTGMRGVAVEFAVASGGGSVTGKSATTNAAGIATVGGWSLGAIVGPNTLIASATGLPSVTFTATGTSNQSPSSCSAAPLPQPLGVTTTGALTSGDCMSDGVFVDFYSVTLNGVDAYVFRQSATFDTNLILVPRVGFLSGRLIAENDNESSATTNSAIKALLPAGSYVLGASSAAWDVTGDYSLFVGTTSPEASGCENLYVAAGVSTTQNILTTDCLRTNGPAYADQFLINLTLGQPLGVSMSSTAVDSFLELYLVNPTTGVRTLVASNDNADTSGTRDARLVYAGTAGLYVILARTALDGQTGGYTLGIQ